MVVLMLNGTAQHDVADAFAAWLRAEAGPQPDPTQEDGQQAAGRLIRRRWRLHSTSSLEKHLLVEFRNYGRDGGLMSYA